MGKAHNFKILGLSFLILSAILTLGGCEKDDICTPDAAVTPRLIIVFRDQLDRDEPKPVADLSVRDIARDTLAPLNEEDAQRLTEGDSIAIPLNGAAEMVRYAFRTGDEEDTTFNADTLEIRYETIDEYVNRACGYRKIFDQLQIIQDPEPPLQQWIDGIEIQEILVDDINTIHVKIYH